MTNPTIDPISYKAGIEADLAGTDEYQPRTRQRVIEILNAQDQNPRSWQQEAIAYIRSPHRTEPQTAPDKCCRDLPASECAYVPDRECALKAAPADAERLALAERIEDAKPGWLPISGHVVTVTLTLNERERLLAILRAGGWRGAACKELLQVPDSSAPHTDKEG